MIRPAAERREAAPRASPRAEPLSGEARQLALIWGVLALASLALRPFWLAVAPLLPPCPFRAITGLPCLTCGTTRAALALLEARPLAALALNPLAAAGGVAFIVGGLLAPVWALLRLPAPRFTIRSTPTLRVALALLLLADWAWLVAMTN